jgi:hypothetical protein
VINRWGKNRRCARLGLAAHCLKIREKQTSVQIEEALVFCDQVLIRFHDAGQNRIGVAAQFRQEAPRLVMSQPDDRHRNRRREILSPQGSGPKQETNERQKIHR